jgi:hypothetical protein
MSLSGWEGKALSLYFCNAPADAWGPDGSEIEMEVELNTLKNPRSTVKLLHGRSK